MSGRRNDLQANQDLELEGSATNGRPVRLRRSSRGVSSTRSQSSRRKAGTSRRKGSKIGGIHQRANKRAGW